MERKMTADERNDYLQKELNNAISDCQKLKCENELLKDTIVKLAMKLVNNLD